MNKLLTEIARLIQQIRQLPRYNCDCLPNDARTGQMADDDAAKTDHAIYCERWVVLWSDLEALLALGPQGEPTLHQQIVEALLHERADELTKEACDNCEDCGELVMCSFHSVLSVLAGHVAIQDANGKWLSLTQGAGKTPEIVKPSASGFSAWWVCFRCWLAYHAPTTGYYGKCQQCDHDTQRWPANPLETLRLTEWRRAQGAGKTTNYQRATRGKTRVTAQDGN